MEEILPESSSNSDQQLKASDYHDFSYQSTSQDMYPSSYCQQNEICVYKDEISQDFKESVDEHSNHSESSITDKKPECQEDTQEQMDSSAECERSSSQERQLTELGNLQNQRVRKRKIEVLSLETRVQVIKESASGVTLRKLAEKFNCGKTQISNILQRKDYWLKEWEMNKNMNYKRKRKQPNEEVNKYVWEWFQKASATHIPISGPLIQEKAREFAEFLNISSFRASNGWLDSFRKRHNIVFRSVDGEKRQLTAS
ncbi:tigger transposable element-derived protein 4-like isoform X4 [Centruroides vittatus]|uniref:tigger transposable element-derived protein 4-like isoform X4 n=1 Tax=Centruroides vittatus TaxID=120091 RepID=UPI0035107AE5